MIHQDEREFTWFCEHIKGYKSILEIGSYDGGSIAYLSRVAGIPDARLRCIDIDLHGTGETLKLTMQALRSQGFDAECLIEDSNSKLAIDWARKDGPYDVIFIDGDHGYTGVRQNWRDYGSMGTIVAFHDINGVEPGVRQFWHELQHICISEGYYTTTKCYTIMGIGIITR